MPSRKTGLFFTMAGVILLAVTVAWAGGTPPAMVQKNCMNCHADFAKMPGVFAGNLSGKALKANTLQIQVNDKQHSVTFNKDTKLENIPDLEALVGGVALRIHYKMDGERRVATDVVVKPKFEVDEDQLINTAELAKLVEMGPEKGNYTLVDSRPPGGYASGFIPTAINIPFPKMKEMAAKLPKDKNKLLIFYCQGFR